MTKAREKAIVLALLALAVVSGCSSSQSLDTAPLKKDGTPSREFERDDLESARDADLLVRLYCEGSESPAQETGCRAHVDSETVCSYGTEAALRAQEKYTGKTGEPAC